eukprot:CAMPEP_0113516932 /NCGR_PEP_ID=MMETSP0014_2-20120614/41913_1 /TAXON_ID=2857 /ORGANISM="Nitzschia sp." /LENGTH=64 /DNA_ID=CAMNT_0000413943 /DNA_START=49 /DNA_END=240 /DNA_ORIENTATION=+ /assembly_acc=CAM_ASM_000159
MDLLAGYGSDDSSAASEGKGKGNVGGSTTKQNDGTASAPATEIATGGVRRPDRRFLQAAPAISV